MEIRILYFSGCPNWRIGVERLRAALAQLGRTDVVVQLEDVGQRKEPPPQWLGSPTVLIDGRDPFVGDDGNAPTEREDALASLDACRIYMTPEGFAGAPSLDQLRTALDGAPSPTKPSDQSRRNT
jgi:hypothetical protein